MPVLRKDELVWQVVDGEVVVLDTRASLYLSLKGSGALLWQRLAEGAADDELAAALVERYGIPRERATADVAAFCASLADRGLLAA